ncbi:MAG: DNA polymerase III subunit alpha, partial [Nitrospirota bacterium]|nr:DNA polymerase III subunit alpha [Nitrospirota bacterium]
YGVILYQEQVMRIANKLANFSLGQADILRKAMGKKNIEVMAKQKEHFVSGAVANGINEKKASKLFDLLANFAEYGFNKSHSAAYAFVSYQTAYLKAHYPVEFMAATLSMDIHDTDKIVKSINECRQMKIDILPPDINLSGSEFRVVGNSIRFGLSAVKGVGAAAIESIIEAREEGGPFASVADFTGRVDTRKVNKKVLESLVKAGAFDSLGITRAAAMDSVTTALNGSGSRNSGQQSIFGEEMFEQAPPVEEWDEAELLRNEKEALGFYITGHPLTKYDMLLTKLKAKKTTELEHIPDRTDIVIGGVLRAIKKKNVKSTGDLMAYITLEDGEGSVEVIVFSELYKNSVHILKKDMLLLVKGSIAKDEKDVRVRAKEVSNLEDAGKMSVRRMEVRIDEALGSSENLQGIKDLVARYPGDCELFLKIRLKKTQTVIATGITISPDAILLNRLEDMVGRGAVTFS